MRHMRRIFFYDDSCRLCRWFVSCLRRVVFDRAEFLPIRCAGDSTQISKEAFERSAQFFDDSGQVHEGARGIVELLALLPKYKWVRWCYLKIPLVGRASEWVHAFVSSVRRLS